MSRILRASIAVAALAALTFASFGPAQATTSFGAPVKISGSSGFEPGVDIAPDGTIFVNEPPGIPGHTAVWRSTTGGASWTQSPVSTGFRSFPGGGDGDIAIGRDGRVYMADLWLGSNSVFRSDDNGQTFTVGTPVSSVPGSDRQWLAVGPMTSTGETVYLAYHVASQTFVARSTDSGLTWPWQSTGTGIGGYGFAGQIVADDTGFVAYPVEANGWIAIARSTNSATTFQHIPAAPGSSDSNVSLAKVGNTLHLVWQEHSDYSINYARSDDLGSTWTDPVTISTGGTNLFPWIDARGSKVAIVWYGADTGAPTNPNTLPASNNWYIRYSQNLTSGTGAFSAPVDAWASPVKTGPICTTGLSCPGADRALGDFFQVAVASNGDSIIVSGSHAVTPKNGVVVLRQTS